MKNIIYLPLMGLAFVVFGNGCGDSTNKSKTTEPTHTSQDADEFLETRKKLDKCLAAQGTKQAYKETWIEESHQKIVSACNEDELKNLLTATKCLLSACEKKENLQEELIKCGLNIEQVTSEQCKNAFIEANSNER